MPRDSSPRVMWSTSATLTAQQLGLLQNLQSAVIDHLTCVGQLHAPAFAQQQTATEFVLQRLDHLADGGLGHVQGVSRAGKAVLAHNLDEVTQGTQVHDNSFYAWKNENKSFYEYR